MSGPPGLHRRSQSSPASKLQSSAVSYNREGAYEVVPVPEKSSRRFHSKTTLRRDTYELKETPDLYVVEVHVVTTDKQERIHSTKLASKALAEFLKRPELAPFEDAATINYSGHRHQLHKDSSKEFPVNHLIIPVSHHTGIDNIIQDSLDKAFEPEVRKESSRRITGSSTKEALSVIIRKKGRTVSPKDKDLYWTSLDLLIRQYAKGEHPAPGRGLEREFFSDFAGKSFSKVVSSDNSDKDITLLGGFDLCIRHQFKFEVFGDKHFIHLDFDLVPTVNSGSVAEILIQSLGHSILGSDVEAAMPAISHMLNGLRVRRNYQMKEAKSGNASKFVSPPECEIKDIKLARDVQPFFVKGSAKVVTVAKYFKKNFPNKSDLKYPALPLANVGKKKPGLECWVPLELLSVNGRQHLRRCGHLTPALKKIGAEFRETGDGDRKLKEIGEGFIKKVNHRQHQTTKDRPSDHVERFLHAEDLESTFPTTTERERLFGSRTETDSREDADGEVIIIHVASVKDGKAPSEDFANDLGERLRGSEFKFTKAPVVQVKSLEELVLQQKGNELLWKAYKDNGSEYSKHTKALIGVVDSTGRTKADIRNIYAEIHRIGDRTAGIATLCTLREPLESRMNGKDPEYLPSNFRRKLNILLGGTNSRMTYCGDLWNMENLMVVGAHVAHPDSGAVKNCPSVAAVVGDTSSEHLYYPGSARLQPTVKEVTANGKVLEVIEHQILDLKAMMIERFQARKRRSNADVTNLLFYRNGLNLSRGKDSPDAEIPKSEMTDIENAFKEVYKDAGLLLNITYVVAQKLKGKMAPRLLSGPTFTTAPEGLASKFAYHVAENEIGITRSNPPSDPQNRDGTDGSPVPTATELQRMTQDLNNSSQLQSAGPHVPQSLALPITLAQKLANRVFDSFYPLITRDFGTFPAFIQISEEKNTSRGKGEGLIRAIEDHYRVGDAEVKDRKTTAGQPDDGKNDDDKKDDDKKDDDKKDGVNASVSRSPWLKELDERMFYV